MDFGAAIFFTDYSMGPAELGRALEARGFGSLWAPEHSHIPLSRRSPFPQGGDLPKKYYDVMDPFVTLAAAARATTRLQVATGVCLVVQRDPIQTAKQVASLDQISDGRFLFGIGAGWNAEEMLDHGTDFKARFKVMRERVEAMRAIWTKSKPEYNGEFVKFPPMMTWPKPVQKPHPPVIVGGGLSLRGAAGDRLRRRLDAARAPARVRRRARSPAGFQEARRRGRARSGDAADHGLRRRRGRRPHQALPRRRRRAPRSSTWRRRRPTRCCRARSLRGADASRPDRSPAHRERTTRVGRPALVAGLRFVYRSGQFGGSGAWRDTRPRPPRPVLTRFGRGGYARIALAGGRRTPLVRFRDSGPVHPWAVQ